MKIYLIDTGNILNIEGVKCIVGNTTDYYRRYYRVIRLDNGKRFFASIYQLGTYLK